MTKHYDITVTGLVQGVFYRASAKAEAARLGLGGFVRNQPDGSVYAEVEGEAEQLELFTAWCRRGPPSAEVDGVRVQEGPVKGLRGFQVR